MRRLGIASRGAVVDLAVRAVFGNNMVEEETGSAYDKENTLLTNPNQWDGAYFMPGVYEGAYLLMSRNNFTYPHAKHTIDDFIT